MNHAEKGHCVIYMDILEHLQELYPTLTKKQKTIADYLIANLEEISYITLAQLSHQTGTSELTLLRFCQKLGCSSFLDLKEQFRDYTQKMIKQASSSSFFLPERISGEASERERILHEICNTEATVFSDFIANINLESVIKASDEIRKSSRIYIFAHDISLVPGKFLQGRLEILYLNAVLIDLSDLELTQKTIQQLTEGDLVIFFSFPRYYFPIGNIAKKAVKIRCTDSDHHRQRYFSGGSTQHTFAALPHLYEAVLQLHDRAHGHAQYSGFLSRHRQCIASRTSDLY